MEMKYTLIYAKRKTISMKISSDGSLTVRAPKGTPRSEIERIVKKHSLRLEEMRKRVMAKERATESVDFKELEKKLADIVFPLVEKYAREMGTSPEKVKFTNAKGRFGSCNNRGTICFSRYLALYPEAAIEYGITYTRVYSAFAPLMLIYHATDNYLRVCGRERLSMWLGIGTQALNIVLDVILIVFLGQGVWAAAFTSCVSMALGSVITLILFRKKRMDLYYTGGRVEKSVFLRILANGSSEFFSSISMSVMSIVYNVFLLKHGGTTGLAAFSVVMYVDSIIGMLVFGMTDAQQPAISYCYGAGLMDKVKAMFRRIILGAVVLSLASLIFMMFAGQYVAPLFVKPEDTKLLTVSIIGMKLFSLSYLTGWVDMCFSSYFTALERPARSMLTSFFGTLVFPIGTLFALTPTLELNGVWLSALASCTLSAIFSLILYFTMGQNAKKRPFI